MPDDAGAGKTPEPASALMSAEPAAPTRPAQPSEHDRADALTATPTAANNGGEAAAEIRAEPERPRNMPELPKVSLELPPDSGLVLIETARERGTATESVEPADAPRPRRVRPMRAESHEEPLQLVETVHKEDPTPPAV